MPYASSSHRIIVSIISALHFHTISIHSFLTTDPLSITAGRPTFGSSLRGLDLGLISSAATQSSYYILWLSLEMGSTHDLHIRIQYQWGPTLLVFCIYVFRL